MRWRWRRSWAATRGGRSEVVDAADLDGVATAEIAGPGFINLTLRPAFIASLVAEVATDPRLGIVPAARPRRVVVDYSAPNVAKEMHIGHLRTTVIGDALVRLFGAVGHDVVRENHIGDWGRPFGMLIEHLVDIGAERAESLGSRRPRRLLQGGDEAVRARTRSSASGPGARVVLLQQGDEETMRLWRLLVTQSAEHWNDLYAKLGVLLTDDDLAGESRYEALMPEVIERLEAPVCWRSPTAPQVVFPPGFTNREGEPLPLIVRSRAGAFTYATSDLACVVDRVERVGATRLLYVVGAAQSQHLAMVFAVSEMAGWLVPPARAEHVSFGHVLGTDRKRLNSRSGEPARFIDVVDEAIERGWAAVAEKNPDLPAEQRAAGRARRRHRCAQVRRPVDGSGPRLRVRLGPDAVVRRQHGAVPAVRPRPDLLDLPPGGGRPADVRATVPTLDRAAGAGSWRCGCSASAPSSPRRSSAASPHRLCTYLYELASDFTAFYEHCPVLGPPMPAPGRVAWR